jgi:hypothetical protein
LTIKKILAGCHHGTQCNIELWANKLKNSSEAPQHCLNQSLDGLCILFRSNIQNGRHHEM